MSSEGDKGAERGDKEIKERSLERVMRETGDKIAVANLKRRQAPYKLEDSNEEEIVRSFCLAPAGLEWPIRTENVVIEPFSEKEVAKVRESFKSGKAPNGDEVYPETVKAIHTAEPELLSDIFNRWVETVAFFLFPSECKGA